MTVVEYLVKIMVKNGVTDIFGIPGGVILELIYTADRTEGITPHLSYHEQAAAFEACGYAQVNHTLGVAYATRGPGFTNMITGIADAYADSLPVLFITAHSGCAVGHSARFEKDQEMDTVAMVEHITKYAAVVEDVNDAKRCIDTAISMALTGRKGPTFLDFSSDIWSSVLYGTLSKNIVMKEKNILSVAQIVKDGILNAERPIVLVGDGIRQGGAIYKLKNFIDKTNIPVITSRCSQDVGAYCGNYFGYIGSHGIRYSNFIFAKADLVIALGNRMSFPMTSKSYLKAFENKKVIRMDVDGDELKRYIPNSVGVEIDINAALNELNSLDIPRCANDWLEVCRELKNQLKNYDLNDAIEKIKNVMLRLSGDEVISADVGNNEFWVSRAYVESDIPNRIIYSKSFGALGCGLPKAIGAYYATRQKVICMIGDQGFQLNIQELQMIGMNKLPIKIVLLNNYSLGMIRSKETNKYEGRYLHTTTYSGYGVPNIEEICRAYGINYISYDSWREGQDEEEALPMLIDVTLDENINLEPHLPIGYDCQNMSPMLPKELYEQLNKL